MGALGLYLRTIRRTALAGPRLGRLDDRLVFVFGSPRSGTTFLAGAIASLPGFVDLGEVNPLKARIPDVSARDLRRILDRVRRYGLVGGRRAVEQTPETAYVLPAVAEAFPEATLVHAVRDGRDVVCSLLERGWLSAGRTDADDAGARFGVHPRFWVEPGREREFHEASDARRCAWAWRRYVSAVLDSGVPVVEVRYERMATEPVAVAADLARVLAADPRHVERALATAHAASVGRWRRDLTPDALAEVEAEAGELLRRLGYDGGGLEGPP